MKTVRAKLTLLNIALVAISLACMGLALRASVGANLLHEIDRQLESEIGSIATTHLDQESPELGSGIKSLPPLPVGRKGVNDLTA